MFGLVVLFLVWSFLFFRLIVIVICFVRLFVLLLLVLRLFVLSYCFVLEMGCCRVFDDWLFA